jgi:hypothetical protein
MGDVGVCMCECRARFLCVHYIVVVTLHKTATPASKRNKDGLFSPSRRKRLFFMYKILYYTSNLSSTCLSVFPSRFSLPKKRGFVCRAGWPAVLLETLERGPLLTVKAETNGVSKSTK